MSRFDHFTARSFIVASVVVAFVAISNAINRTAHGFAANQSCFTAGAPQCPSCTYPYPPGYPGYTVVNCNARPAPTFMYGGCVTNGPGCTPAVLDCGGLEYTCATPPALKGANSKCVTTVSTCL